MSENMLIVRPRESDYPSDMDISGFLTQWRAMRRALQDAGFNLIEPNGDARPRWLFPRDVYLKIGEHVIFPDLACFPSNHEWHTKGKGNWHGDNRFFREFMTAGGFKVHTLDGVWFENGDFVQDKEKRILFAGQRAEWFGHPSTKDARRNQALAAKLRQIGLGDWRVIPLGIDPQVCKTEPLEFYHLDLALAERQKRAVAHCPDAFTADGLATLSNVYRDCALLPIRRADAARCALNLVGKEGIVVPTFLPDDMEKGFAAHGVTCIDPRDYGVADFSLSKAGVHCATNEI